MQRPKQWQQNFSFGGRLPWAVGLLLATTVVLSLFTVIAGRHVAPLAEWVSLVPASVWRGQIWRLVTWPFVEPGPVGLIFGALALYWFGPPLAQRWGSPRFLFLMMAAVFLSSVGTCLIALADPGVMGSVYAGTWVMTSALVVAWGLSHPDTIVRIYFVLPVRGYWMAWLTVGLTVVFAAYSGWAGLLPELVVESVVLGWFYRQQLAARWAAARRASAARKRPVKRTDEGRREGGVVVDLRTGEPRRPKDHELN